MPPSLSLTFLSINSSHSLGSFDSDLENSDPIVAVYAITIDASSATAVCHSTLQCLSESHSTQFIPSMTFIFHAKWIHFGCVRVRLVCSDYKQKGTLERQKDKERPKVPFCGLCTPIFVYLTLLKQLSLSLYFSLSCAALPLTICNRYLQYEADE